MDENPEVFGYVREYRKGAGPEVEAVSCEREKERERERAQK